MKIQKFSAEERGIVDHGWLKAKHSFSFGSWYNPELVNFGALRVLNDDHVKSGAGFAKHPHDNMEIITIPFEGALAHEDSMGNGSIIRTGDVQVMSAGNGIFHSEKNASSKEDVKLFQIWIIPNKQNVSPRYDQINYDLDAAKNTFVQVVSPNPDDAGTWIHQNAWIKLAKVEAGKSTTYAMENSKNGLFLMAIDEGLSIAENELRKRDALGITAADKVVIKANKNARVIAIEIPMEY